MKALGPMRARAHDGVVSDARVGADEGVGSYLAMVTNDDWASYGCWAVDDRIFSYCHVVGYGWRVFCDSMVVGLEVVED